MNTHDHPIFTQSMRFIRSRLYCPHLEDLEKQVLERIIHSSGDFSLQDYLNFSKDACSIGISALKRGAPILTDTFMAAAAVTPMAARTLNTSVHCVLEWSNSEDQLGITRTALGMERSWKDLADSSLNKTPPIVLFGSSPTALETMLRLILKGATAPSLIIGMPVGFIRVLESKRNLANTDIPQIRLDGYRGGAGMAAATVNALLRASC